MNDNQNHRVREGWTSSRVIAEPGGGGSLMLGMAPPPRKVESVPAKENTQPAAAIDTKQEEEAKKEEEGKPKVETTVTSTPTPSHITPTPHPTPTAAAPVLPGLGAPSQPVSANAFASGANMNGAQVMTGRPTSRVRNPGGTGGPDSGWKLG